MFKKTNRPVGVGAARDVKHHLARSRRPNNKIAKAPQAARKRITPRQAAAIRLGEMLRLAPFRIRHATSINQHGWIFVACHALVRLRHIEKCGLDFEHLNDFMRRCGLVIDDEDDALRTIHDVSDFRERHPRRPLLVADTAARMLDLTAEERWICKIVTMGAVDKSRAERKTRVADEKRTRDRTRQRDKRMAAGCQSRAQWEATSKAQTRPWEAAGISRATWYRRRETGPSPDICTSSRVERHTCLTEMAAPSR